MVGPVMGPYSQAGIAGSEENFRGKELTNKEKKIPRVGKEGRDIRFMQHKSR